MRNKKILGFISITLITLLLTLVSFPPLLAQAAEVKLDTTFNGNGYIIWDEGANNDESSNDIKLDPNGKYIVTGYINNGSDADMAIWRYNSDGSLDTTFNSPHGYVTHNSAAGGNDNDGGLSIQVQSDGKYVVAGFSVAPDLSCDMTIWRYNSNGTLDTTFNTVGYVTHHDAAGGNDGDKGLSLQIQPDGKYIISGHSYSSIVAEDADMVIWRYNSNGTMDSSFGNGTCNNAVGAGGTMGCVVHMNPHGGSYGWEKGHDIKIQSDGKYVIVGRGYDGDSWESDMVIWRYNSNGTMDSTFGDGSCNNAVGTGGHYGCIVHDNAAEGSSSNCDRGWSLQIQSDGKLVIAGQSKGDNSSDMVIWRYNSNGTLDTTFNGKGYTSHNNAAGGNSGDRGNRLQIQTDGKYVVTGRSYDGSNYNMVIWRYNSNGTMDPSFGDGTCNNGIGTGSAYGCVVHNADMDTNNGYKLHGSSLLIQSDGKYVIAGSDYGSSSYNLAIWRYENLNQIDGLPANLDAEVGGINIETDTSDGSYGSVTISINKGTLRIADVQTDMSSDRDWSLVTGDSNTEIYASYIDGLTSVPGTASTMTLYIPRQAEDEAVAICPGATTMDDVTDDCPGIEYKSVNDSDVTIVTIGTVEYFKVTGLTGTGGFSLMGLPQTGQPIVYAYIAVFGMGLVAIVSNKGTFVKIRTKR